MEFNKALSIIQTVPRINTESSGPTYTVQRLCENLHKQGASVSLHLLGSARVGDQNGFTVVKYPAWDIPWFRRFGFSPSMARGLRKAAGKADILHNNSLWMAPNIYPASAVKKTKCKLVVSPRGTLSSWALNRSRFRKGVVWRLGQRKVLERAELFHATAESEAEDIRRLGFRQPIAVIPNGIDVPVMPQENRQNSTKRLLFLSRIHSKKGVDILLRAWARLEKEFPGWQLDIVGPLDGKYPKAMEALGKEMSLQRVSFVGELNDEEKSRAYTAADLFVLPSHSENFGVVVAEALAHRTPVVVTKGAPWEGLAAHQSGWWIDIGVEPLVACLKEALACSTDYLTAMGAAGRCWMEDEYSWDRVAGMMMAAYEWTLWGGKKPDFIVLD